MSVDILIPIKIDSRCRTRNLNIILNYIKEYYSDYNIHIVEGDITQKLHPRIFTKDINYNYVKLQHREHFHQAKLINDLCNQSTNDIICIQDADVFITKEQFNKSVEYINSGEYDMISPYNGTCYNLLDDHVFTIQKLLHDKQPIVNNINTSLCKKRCNGKSKGGCYFFNKQKFIEGGMANENFVGWGGEDDELLHRFTKLNYKFYRLEGVLYHLPHDRTNNAKPHHELYQNNMIELQRIIKMTKEELQEEIKTWSWVKKYI